MKIVKLKSLLDGAHPNNIEKGYEKTGAVYEDPKVGECFYCGTLRTSLVEEVIDANTFRTTNSIYHISLLDEVDFVASKTFDKPKE